MNGWMSPAAATAVADRHVVFPELTPGKLRPLNLSCAPRGATGGARAVRWTTPADEPELGADERALLDWVFGRFDLDWRQYRPGTLRRRLPACLRLVRAASPAEALGLLRRRPDLADAALGALVIGVTSLFRDPPVFDALARHVLPPLARSGRRLRVWSAGCSDGAELYSIAILLDRSNILHRCELLGTDCRADALTRAVNGWYPADAARLVPSALREEYFAAEPSPGGGAPGFRARPWLRAVPRWRPGDVLAAAPEPGPWDLIFCRNLAIYLEPWGLRRLWANLSAALRPGGVLVAGKAERPALSFASGAFTQLGPCLYQWNGLS